MCRPVHVLNHHAAEAAAPTALISARLARWHRLRQPVFINTTIPSKTVSASARRRGIHFCHSNFLRQHKSLRVTIAMVAGVSDRMWSLEEVVEQTSNRRITGMKAIRLFCWKRVVVAGVLIITLVPRPGFADCKTENPNTMPGIEAYAVQGMVPEGSVTTPVTLSVGTGATTQFVKKCQNGAWVTIRTVSQETTPSH
jgi:hypothetical protein